MQAPLQLQTKETLRIPTGRRLTKEEGQRRFRGSRGSQKPKPLNESMKLNWNFQRGGGGVVVFKLKTAPWGEYECFLEHIRH